MKQPLTQAGTPAIDVHGHVFTVDFDGEAFQTVYPAPLAEYSTSFYSVVDAWSSIVLQRLSHPDGNMWPIKDAMDCARALWSLLADIATEGDEELITEPFLSFVKGTRKLTIWHWFEEYFDITVANDLMQISRIQQPECYES